MRANSLSLSSIVIAASVIGMVFGAGGVQAQVAGSTTIGVSPEEVKTVALGWSAKKHILGKSVYNDKNEKIGVVDDLIVTPDQAVSYAIVGVGGFIGMGKHDVAIPAAQLKENHGKLVVAGASKGALKSMPTFTYAK
jgi:hypothetical protein